MTSPEEFSILRVTSKMIGEKKKIMLRGRDVNYKLKRFFSPSRSRTLLSGDS